MKSRAKVVMVNVLDQCREVNTGNVNFDIGRFRKDMLCNIYKNNMSFFLRRNIVSRKIKNKKKNMKRFNRIKQKNCKKTINYL